METDTKIEEQKQNNQSNLVHDIAQLSNKCNSDYPRGHQDLIGYTPNQHPLVVQLGGCDPAELAKAAKICEEFGYDEINLNVGCPSPKGSFGACLMKEPELVAEIMKTLSQTVSVPTTVKCRLGVDEYDSYEFTYQFVKIVSEQGNVKHFIIHARKAFLKGLNPAENRNIPPLIYERVIQLKKDFPHLMFTINGGFKTIEQIKEILKPENQLEGCMIGRLVMENPFYLSDFDRQFFGKENPGYSRREILQIWGDYGAQQLTQIPKLAVPQILKPINNLFANQNNNKQFRQFISDKQNFNNARQNDGQGFKIFIQNCINLMEILNKDALDLKPPSLQDPIENVWSNQKQIETITEPIKQSVQ